MPSTLSALRTAAIDQMGERVEQAIQYERGRPHHNAEAQLNEIVQESRVLATKLAELDPTDREALLATLRYEFSIMLLVCSMHADLLTLGAQLRARR